jgi:hypothetical protein
MSSRRHQFKGLSSAIAIAGYTLSLGILFALGGCTTAKKAIITTEGVAAEGGNIALPCKLGEDKSAASAAANRSKIVLTLDGSASMLGYVKDSNSSYVQMLKLLDRVSLAAPGGVEYARIDSGKKSISRTEFQQAFSPRFYTGQMSKIADAFPDTKAIKGEQLIAIVTDLQPDDGDVNLVSKRILEDYLKKDGYAVAVWGIKSEFDGKVYPPNNAPAYPYSSKTADRGRPFYLLLAGRYDAIADFAKTIRSQDSSFLKDKSQLTIFTPDRSISTASYLTPSQDNLPKGVTSPTSLSQERFEIDNGEQPVQFLEFGENSNPEHQSLKYSLNYQPNPDTTFPTQLEPKHQVRKYNGDLSKPEFAVSNSTKLFDLTSSLADNKIGIEAKFDPTKIESGLYYLTVDLTATGINTPQIWADWNDRGKKDGGKTQGLSDFLDSLSINTTTVMKEKSPVVARLCYGIQRD